MAREESAILLLDLPREHLELLWVAVDHAAKLARDGDSGILRGLARRFRPPRWSSKGCKVAVSAAELVLIGRVVVMWDEAASTGIGPTLAPYLRAAIKTLETGLSDELRTLERDQPSEGGQSSDGEAASLGDHAVRMREAAASVSLSRIAGNGKAQALLFNRLLRRELPERGVFSFDLDAKMRWVVVNYLVAMENGLDLTAWDAKKGELRIEAARHGMSAAEWNASFDRVMDTLRRIVSRWKAVPSSYDEGLLRHIDLSVAENSFDGQGGLVLDYAVSQMKEYLGSDRRRGWQLASEKGVLVESIALGLREHMPDVADDLVCEGQDPRAIVAAGVQFVLDAMKVVEFLGGVR